MVHMMRLAKMREEGRPLALWEVSVEVRPDFWVAVKEL